ncbi:MAG TPA: hypothetical protein VFY23_04210 [Candidatus Limnocylindrales bacterium]|nr:hypothetical protein [Candidatus Limnocylindrales bacterium]
MKTRRAILATSAALMIIGVWVLPASADEPPPPIVGEPLASTVVVRYTVQPGAQFPWHTHAGPVVVNVASGALTYIGAETCAEETYSAGQPFVDAGNGHAHSAGNPTSSPTILIATFFAAPASGRLLIPTDPADC